jgi:predicted glycogen debranching enzyme
MAGAIPDELKIKDFCTTESARCVGLQTRRGSFHAPFTTRLYGLWQNLKEGNMPSRSQSAPALPEFVKLERDICANLSPAESREWLVTNGIGGFASGTVAGLLTRRYHGLLVAALDPPQKRTLLVAKFDELATMGEQTFALGANRWSSGTIDPQGFQYIEQFALEGTTPAWKYAFGGAALEKRIWMQHGANTTYVEYRAAESKAPVELAIKAVVNYRDFHSLTHAGDWRMRVEPVEHGIRVVAFDGAVPFYLLSAGATAEVANEWYCNYELAAERERGLDDCGDNLFAATFRVTLQPGQAASLVLSTDADANLDAAGSLMAEQARPQNLLTAFYSVKSRRPSASRAPASKDAPPDCIAQLSLAADQFVLEPATAGGDSPGAIAGYPWFGVWSRDTMIALPGLTLATGRPEIARSVLHQFGGHVNGGMLPNFFPESGESPEYNSVDAALWYVEAVRQYMEATGDLDLAQQLFPALAEIVDAYSHGTRYGIHTDAADGLLYAGEKCTNLTWMDAKINGQPVTPRIGKPIEINALWINALETLGDVARKLRKPDEAFTARATLARNSFSRFWNAERDCCFDVLDSPRGNEAALRPNQIFAVSLPINVLSASQRFAIVEICAQHLLTPFGLRTLSPQEQGYCAQYTGAQDQRAAAYHQGTVWPWLLGPFALAHFRVNKDREAALHLFDAMPQHLLEAGLGGISEVFDAEPPFTPRGCPAQAWSVAEILRAWTAINSSAVK